MKMQTTPTPLLTANREFERLSSGLYLATVEDLIASGILAEVEAEVRTRHPRVTKNRFDAREYDAAGGHFALAKTAVEIFGCGAFRPLGTQTVTIEYLFVRQAHQRRGVGRRILQMLGDEARRRGYIRAVFETAQYQPEAIGLVQSSGYSKIDRLHPNDGNIGSVCFGKSFSVYR